VQRFTATGADGSETTDTNLLATLHGASADTILIVADRDGGALGTATLIELGRVFAVEQHTRTILLASLGGGAFGEAGARWLARHLPGGRVPVGVIAIRSIGSGIVALNDRGSRTDRARAGLWAGVEAALASVTGASVIVRPGIIRELAEGAAPPRAAGAQAAFVDAGIPAVEIVNVAAPGPPIATARMTADGQALNDVIGALDAGATAAGADGSYIRSGDRVVSGWLLALLAISLLAGPGIAGAELVARAWREHVAIEERVLAACTIGVPLAATGLGIRTIALLGWEPSVSWAYPYGVDRWPDPTSLLGALGGAAIGWLGMRLVRRPRAPHEDPATRATAALAAALAVGGAGAMLAILVSPLAGVLFVPALHAWIGLERLRRGGAIGRAAAIWVPLLAPGAAVAIGLRRTPGELVRMVADGRIPAAVGVGATLVVAGAAVLTGAFVRRVG
jgi:hypothetical protein